MAGRQHGRHTRSPRHLAASRPAGRNARHLPPHRHLAARRAVLVLACAATLVGLLVSLPDATATGATFRFTPSADAYVSALRPTANFGSANELLTRSRPKTKRSYLRFDATSVSGTVARATLQLYSKDRSATGYEIRAVADHVWREQTITYNDAPPPGPVLATARRVLARTFTSVDVTPLVSSAGAGAGAVDLVVTTADDSGLRFSSRESGEFAPRLVVETSTTSTTQMPTAATHAPSSTSLAPTSTTQAPTSTTRPPATTSSTTTTTTTTTTNSSTTTLSPGGWVNVVNDRFDSGGIPDHWTLYDSPYRSNAQNCPAPSHVTVSGGSLHLLMAYETSGSCGAGWYTAGMQVKAAYGAVHQRVTVRWRVVSSNPENVRSHRIIPMRWVNDPDFAWYEGEADYCEGSGLSGCSTFLHYRDTSSAVSHSYAVDLTQWHTMRFETRPGTDASGHPTVILRAYIDDLASPAWTYIGSETTIPSAFRRTVLQQECRSSGCPAGTTGTEDIQIDWITIDNLA
jgi:hypothetical protein